MTAGICGVAAPIPDEHRVWRRAMASLHWHTWDSDRQRWLPRGNTVDFDPELSTVWADHMESTHGAGPGSALDGYDRYTLVFEVGVSACRAIRCQVTHSPDGPCPLACAHTLVSMPPEVSTAHRKEIKSIRMALGRAMSLVYGTITAPPPPGA